MSIAASLAALGQAKTDIADAITAQGGTVGEGDGFADFAADIATIATGYKLETAEETVTATGVGVISYTPQEISEVLGALLVYKAASTVEVHTGMSLNVRIGNTQWGAYRQYTSESSTVRFGTSYGAVLLPSVGNPAVRFAVPDGFPGTEQLPYRTGTYQIIVWGN